YFLPRLLYSATVIPLAYWQRDLMNADAMVYIRRAQCLLHGQFYWFISEHWSLMLSWLIAPLLAMKMDGLYAARGVLCLVGAVHLALVVALMRQLLKVHWIWHLLAGIVLAPFLAIVAVRGITPGLLLVAGPWIAAMSWKYGHLTMGSAGAAAHGITAVGFEGILPPAKSGLEVPPGPYVTVFETPEKLFPRWSPFANREAFKYQLEVIALHALELRR